MLPELACPIFTVCNEVAAQELELKTIKAAQRLATLDDWQLMQLPALWSREESGAGDAGAYYALRSFVTVTSPLLLLLLVLFSLLLLLILLLTLLLRLLLLLLLLLFLFMLPPLLLLLLLLRGGGGGGGGGAANIVVVMACNSIFS